MSAASENIPWELLVRYVAGGCSRQEVLALSERIETEPAIADALAELLLQAVLVRDDVDITPECVRVAVPVTDERFPWLSPLILVMAAAVVVSFTTLWFFAFRTQDRAILRIASIEGVVNWTGRNGEVREGLKSGDTLPGGLVEALSDESTITLVYDDKTTITLLGHSSATLSEDGQKRVHLREGGLSADVEQQPRDKPLLIHTPTALLEVLGTRFEVDSDSANTRLSVNEGRVRMTRLMDGRVAEVPAQHEAIASLEHAREMSVLPRARAEVIWRSDFASGPSGAGGRWLPAETAKPARVAAEPVFLQQTSRGAVTIHRVSLTLPWQLMKTLQVRPESRLRITGSTTAAAPLELMLLGRKPEGGHAGNFFREIPLKNGSWQVESRVGDFRGGSVTSGISPPAAMQLHHIAIYTINTDANLEIESVEVLRE